MGNDRGRQARNPDGTYNGAKALVQSGPERTVALRKLLEAKDAAVRATAQPGG